jgi:putative endonuclease
MWYLYVLRCADGTLYTGVTTDLARRCAEHNTGRGSHYTAGRRPVQLVASWAFADRSAAQAAESAFRRQGRSRKLKLIAERLPFLGSSFLDLERMA